MSVPVLALGQVFARDFRILGKLAEGGMGAVYVVEQLSTGKRRALKVMLPALVEDARARERFAQEARISAHIDSEHVVETVSAGIDAAPSSDVEGQLSAPIPWLAMELLEGEDLATAIKRRGPLPPADVFEILQQLGDGLGAAHAKGIVHRDLKPENLFIAVSRRRGVPFTLKILDFGIAKITQESRTAATVTGAVGSPLWMAPEQTEQVSHVRPATDVWALGLVAFHVLTGKHYWRVANHPEIRLTALFTEVLVLPLEPASERAASLGVGHLIPRGFDAWFARCLQREPERRFRDAKEAVAALGPHMGIRDVEVPPTSEHPQAPSLPRTVAMPVYGGGATGPLSAPGVPVSSYPGLAASSHPGLASGAPNAGVQHAPLGTVAGHTPGAPPPGPGWQQPYVPAHGRTPYAVHAATTATSPVLAPRRGAGWWIFLGAIAALLGAGLSAVGVAVALRWDDLSGRFAHPPPDLGDGGTSVSSGDALDAGTDTASPDAQTASAGPRVDAAPAPEEDAGPRAVRAPERERFTWADGAMQHWRGTATGESGRWSVSIDLMRSGASVSGVIHWRLLSSTRHAAGTRLEEYVSGWYLESGALGLRGAMSSNPLVLPADVYDLRLSGTGAIEGRSRTARLRVTAMPSR